ncbi:methyl-accepting chemotaxis protein [Niallia circulans]|uniref:Methyl-accepting chemotaxis protein n=2 Tax=Niallia circulans TaxID=1397 RepID=A0A553SJD2_NIACI|nr:methyl-accepting chemotaxis protein [Niallia circulans]
MNLGILIYKNIFINRPKGVVLMKSKISKFFKRKEGGSKNTNPKRKWLMKAKKVKTHKRKKKFISIRKKLILSFLTILLIPSLIISIVSYIIAKEKIEQNLIISSHESVKFIHNEVAAITTKKEQDATFLANAISASMLNGDRDEIRRIFTQYLGQNQDVLNVYYVREDGEVYRNANQEVPAGMDALNQSWYKEALDSYGNVVMLQPREDEQTRNSIVTFSKVTYDKKGVIAIDLKISSLTDMVRGSKIGEQGYMILLDAQGNYIYQPNSKADSKSDDNAKWVQDLYKENSGEVSYTQDGQEKLAIYESDSKTGWKIAGIMNQSEISNSSSTIFSTTGIVLIAALLIGGALIFYIIRSIIMPLKLLAKSAERISDGDLTEDITMEASDEIGLLAKSFASMQQTLREVVTNLNHSMEQVTASSEQLVASAGQTTAASNQVTTSVQQIANDAENITTSIGQTSTSIEDVLQGVIKIADKSTAVAALSKDTHQLAEEGGAFVEKNLKQMKFIHHSIIQSNEVIGALNNRSKEIGKIIQVIGSIADQTNLLALNAAIESARAGEHGKGFSVVANEVRKLAEQSQESAKLISSLIADIQKDTDQSVVIMGEVSKNAEDGLSISEATSDKFAQIIKSTSDMGPQMEDVSGAAQQMSAGLQEVSSAASDIATIAVGNAAGAEEVAAASEEQLASMEEINASAKALTLMAEELLVIVNKFKV